MRYRFLQNWRHPHTLKRIKEWLEDSVGTCSLNLMPKHRSSSPLEWGYWRLTGARRFSLRMSSCGKPKRIIVAANNFSRISKILLSRVGYCTFPHWMEGAQQKLNWRIRPSPIIQFKKNDEYQIEFYHRTYSSSPNRFTPMMAAPPQAGFDSIAQEEANSPRQSISCVFRAIGWT